MKAMSVIGVSVLFLFAAAPVRAQTDDIAAERSKLGNQRIQTEVEIREREEEELRIKAEAEARLQAESRAAAARAEVAETLNSPPQSSLPQENRSTEPSASANTGDATDGADVSQMLEQLRTLGELKDAGHLSDEEFQIIKQRIIESGR